MTKEEVKAILTELLASGDFNVSVDEAEVTALVEKATKPLHSRLLVLEVRTAPPLGAADTAITTTGKTTAKVRVKGGAK